jgi:pimeloyl-ACP methyl ester carboxylesterase
MNEPHPCDHACPLSEPCPDRASCPAAAPPPSLADSLRRCKQEAERHVCDTGRYRCSYLSWGAGPPLLLVPGLADGPLNFVPVMTRLSRQFRCLTYALPCGRGDGARLARYTHADLVADLFAVLDHAGARQSYVFGSSFGSTIALAALRVRPERLPRAILQGGFARRALAPAERLLAALARYWPGSMRHLPLRTAVLRRGHAGPFAACPPDLWPFFLEQNGAAPIAAVARRALILHRLDLRPLLPEVRQPLLLVCGEGDPLVGKDCEEALLAGLPNAARVEIRGCGHFPYLTHPDLLAAVVGDFLTPRRASDYQRAGV